jgi:tRNA pseudouridine38-40 synthase
VAEVLQARDRRASGITAPAGGLYFVGVDYDPAFGLPASSPEAVAPLLPGGPVQVSGAFEADS